MCHQPFAVAVHGPLMPLFPRHLQQADKWSILWGEVTKLTVRVFFQNTVTPFTKAQK